MASSKVFISPGVYTSEKDITYVTRNVGVTTLGLVGETTKGPAFQPIFITNYDEFRSFFGGLNAKKIKENNAPQYELPYIAKSYLTKSNQLFVTRVLGFSGYDAGQAWAITLDASLDTSTSGVTGTYSYSGSPFITYTADVNGNITDIISSDPLVQELYDRNKINFTQLATASVGDTFNYGPIFDKVTESGCLFTGVSFNVEVDNVGTDISGNTTGTTIGDAIHYSGNCYSDVENKVVALIRSRGRYNGTENLIFECNTPNSIGISPNSTQILTNPLAPFSLTGTSQLQGVFDYTVSFDRTRKDYIVRVLGTNVQDNNTALFVEEIYTNMFDDLMNANKVRGINATLINYNTDFNNYKEEYQPAVTPYIVSEVRGNKVLRLFRFWTISDGNSANHEFKISIINIRPDERLFDVIIRSYYDTDANPIILESFSKCSMDPSSDRYIGRRIGTLDGEYISNSNYVLVEIDDEVDSSDAFPAGFVGYPIRDYSTNGNINVQAPDLEFKKTYTTFENKRKAFLGLSNIVGIDQDFFDYKGVPNSTSVNIWTELTKGFHLDIDASSVSIDNVEIIINSSGATYSPIFEFETGNAEFKNDFDLTGTDYEKVYARKFTLVPYGGFDGWDVYRTRRTNLDTYRINGTKGALGLVTGAFSNRALSTGDNGINSDYYAYFEAIRTFANPEQININVLATPGIDMIDNTNLIEDTIEMVETERKDSIYITTLPDTDGAGDVITAEDIVSSIDGEFDSNYTATYWPWIQVNDTENNKYIWMPPTRDVVRNIALTDNIAFSWFAVAGIERGHVDAIKARKTLTLPERDTLYDNRINPIATYPTDGVKIWGNKTLQVKDSALTSLNVRRLLLQARKLISAVAIRLLFEQNDDVVRNQFLGLVNPILNNIRSERGLVDFRVTLDNSPESIDRGELCGKIFIKPTKSLEYIEVEFNIMNTGASFDDI